ncbi:MAG: hypothetical protein AAGC77_08825 [Pseudomonadota bacterium]
MEVDEHDIGGGADGGTTRIAAAGPGFLKRIFITAPVPLAAKAGVR